MPPGTQHVSAVEKSKSVRLATKKLMAKNKRVKIIFSTIILPKNCCISCMASLVNANQWNSPPQLNQYCGNNDAIATVCL